MNEEEHVPEAGGLDRQVLDRLEGLQDLFVRRLSEDRDKRHLIEDLSDRLRAAEEGVVQEYLTPFVIGAARIIDRIDAHAFTESRPDVEPERRGKEHLSFVRGVRSELLSLLEQHGVEQVRVDGPLDPNVHEIVQVQGTPDEQASLYIHALVQRGFRYRSRLVRPARVIASVAAPRAERPAP